MDAGSSGPHWRPMRPADLAAVSRIAAIVHPGYPERDAVFAERLLLCPEGCFVLGAGDGIAGYAISHPWRGDPPPLDTLLGELPAEPDAWHIHDLAILPERRGSGAGSAVLARIEAAARAAGLADLALVSVGAAASFWRRAGFAEAVPQPEDLARIYGTAALHMKRSAGAEPGTRGG